MERGAEIFAALTYFALGLSHIVQPRAWAELFLLLKSQGKAGVFLDGFINLLLGAIIVSFHNVWHGLAMVVTIIGWGQVIKGLRIMVLPPDPPEPDRPADLARTRLDVPAGRCDARCHERPVRLHRARALDFHDSTWWTPFQESGPFEYDRPCRSGLTVEPAPTPASAQVFAAH